jgi:hypothetical protein
LDVRVSVQDQRHEHWWWLPRRWPIERRWTERMRRRRRRRRRAMGGIGCRNIY